MLKSGNVAYLQHFLDKGFSLRVDHRDDLIDAAEGGIDMINFLSKHVILMGDPGEDNIDRLIKKGDHHKRRCGSDAVFL